MKKIIALLLLICTFALCLVSCASLDKYEDNLGKDYEVNSLNDEEIEELIEELNEGDIELDPDDYDIEDGFFGDDDDNQIYVFECKSSSKAKKLSKDLKDAFEELDEDDIEITRKGKFVLVGTEDGIEDALGK